MHSHVHSIVHSQLLRTGMVASVALPWLLAASAVTVGPTAFGEAPERHHFGDGTGPALTSIFVSLNNETKSWTAAQWDTDLKSMAALGIESFTVHHVATGLDASAPSEGCPLGRYETYYPTSTAGPCVVDAARTDTVDNLMAAAKNHGLKVYLGLAYWEGPGDMTTIPFNATALPIFLSTQLAIFDEVWALYGNKDGDTALAGVYTGFEQGNGENWLGHAEDYAKHYLEPLAVYAKAPAGAEGLEVWASPYLAMNDTRYTDAGGWIAQPTLYAYELARVLDVWAPTLDFQAVQDSMGHLGNSYQNVTDFMTSTEAALDGTSHAAALWQNVELFENNPADCQWPDECSGRQPAPWERIAKQLGNECNKPWRCTAWEWHSCLSPSCTESPVHEQAVENYNAYVAYLGGGAAGGEARGPI